MLVCFFLVRPTAPVLLLLLAWLVSVAFPSLLRPLPFAFLPCLIALARVAGRHAVRLWFAYGVLFLCTPPFF